MSQETLQRAERLVDAFEQAVRHPNNDRDKTRSALLAHEAALRAEIGRLTSFLRKAELRAELRNAEYETALEAANDRAEWEKGRVEYYKSLLELTRLHLEPALLERLRDQAGLIRLLDQHKPRNFAQVTARLLDAAADALSAYESAEDA